MTSNEIIDKLKKIDLMGEQTDEETGEFLYSDIEIKALYSSIIAAKEDKLIAIEDYYRSKNDEILRYKEKKAKQDANIKRTQKEQEQLRFYQNLLLEGEKLKTDDYTFSYRTTKSVEVDPTIELYALPVELYKTTYAPNKAAIKKELENGWTYDGIKLVENTSLNVR
jgi:hypothetical protein